MAKYIKWIGGGLGWALGGPIGALIGYFIGSIFSQADIQKALPQGKNRPKTQGGDFSASLLVLSAAMMRADHRVMRSELEYVKAFFVQQFGIESTKDKMQVLKKMLETHIPVHDVCTQIRDNMDYSSRLQLLHFLFGISNADGEYHEKEVDLIKQIASYSGITTADYESIMNMFVKSRESFYKILEIKPEATDDEVKLAYRTMAKKFHPDKVSHLGDEFKVAAEQKFTKIQEAYEAIKEERGLN